MSKTLSIDPPKGYKFQSVDESTGAINLVEIPFDVMERIKSLEDIFREAGKNSEDYQYTGTDPDKIMLNATAIALLIARVFNENKEADWSNSSQPKYFIYQEYSPSSGWSLNGVVYRVTFTLCGARLAFLNRNHALKAYELFGKEVYQKINHLIPQENA